MLLLRRRHSIVVTTDGISHRTRTCFPVNPWQITRVFLSTHTLAVDDIWRPPALEAAETILEARELVVVQGFILMLVMVVIPDWMTGK